MSSDTVRMLSQFLGYEPWSTHHPLGASLVYGSVFSLGRAVGGDSAGVFLIAAAQAAVYALTCAHLVRSLYSLPSGTLYAAIATVFFAANPLFGVYVQYVVKDSLFAAVFALYVCSLARSAARARGGAAPLSARDALPIALAAYGVGMLRNNGLYVVALSLPFACAVCDSWKDRAKWLMGAALVIAAIPLSNLGLATALHASYGSAAEVLSIPFQQTARYALSHPGDVEDWERQAIDEVFDYGHLGELYDPNISDPVKGSVKDGWEAALPEYFMAWASQGLRHPDTYLDATAVQTYGYWYPTLVDRYGAEVGGGDLMESDNFTWVRISPARLTLAPFAWLQLVRAVPLLGYLTFMGAHTWLLLAGVALLLRSGKGRYATVLLPSLILLLTCVAGPQNGSLRYGMGVVFAFPVCLGFTLQLARDPGQRGEPPRQRQPSAPAPSPRMAPIQFSREEKGHVRVLPGDVVGHGWLPEPERPLHGLHSR